MLLQWLLALTPIFWKGFDASLLRLTSLGLIVLNMAVAVFVPW